MPIISKQLRPKKVVQGLNCPEPVQMRVNVPAAYPMRFVTWRVNVSMACDSVLTFGHFTSLEASPDAALIDDAPHWFRLGIGVYLARKRGTGF